MPQALLPVPLGVAKALGGILNKDVKAVSTPPIPLLAPLPFYVGYYDDGTGSQPEGLWLSDLPLTASLGAALTLIPAGAAADAAKAGKMTVDLTENAQEVCNIVANCWQLKRVRLNGFFAAGTTLPPHVQALVDKPGQRMDMAITVPGYVGGRLILLGKEFT